MGLIGSSASSVYLPHSVCRHSRHSSKLATIIFATNELCNCHLRIKLPIVNKLTELLRKVIETVQFSLRIPTVDYRYRVIALQVPCNVITSTV